MGNTLNIKLPNESLQSSENSQSSSFVPRKSFHNIDNLREAYASFLPHIITVFYTSECHNYIALISSKTLRFLRMKELSSDYRNFSFQYSESLKAIICFQNKTLWICTSKGFRSLSFLKLSETGKIRAVAVPCQEEGIFLAAIENKINIWETNNGSPRKQHDCMRLANCQYIHSITPLQEKHLILANTVNPLCSSSSYILINWKTKHILREYHEEHLSFFQNITLNSTSSCALITSLRACDLSVNLLSTVQVLNLQEQAGDILSFSDKDLVFTSVMKSPTIFSDTSANRTFFLDYHQNEVWYVDAGKEEEFKQAKDHTLNIHGIIFCKYLYDNKKISFLITGSCTKKRLDLFIPSSS